VGNFRSGFVAVIGRPNVGKSTLINALVGQKVAIISEKPQTTRRTIRAVLTLSDAQVVFVDTPGFHKPKDHLGEHLNKAVRKALSDVDAVLFLVDAADGIGAGDRFIAGELKEINAPIILLLNKIDRVGKARLSEQLAEAGTLDCLREIVAISALKRANIETLLGKLIALMPEGPQYYPVEMATDLPLEEQVAELIREQVLAFTREEIPYSVAVEVEEIKAREHKALTDVRGMIYVERDTQKGILIGQGGRMLKKIGQRSRVAIEALLGNQVYLELKVKLKKDWRKDDRIIKMLGYGE
jgi:GTP-binding protein Era